MIFTGIGGRCIGRFLVTSSTASAHTSVPEDPARDTRIPDSPEILASRENTRDEVSSPAGKIDVFRMFLKVGTCLNIVDGDGLDGLYDTRS